MYVLIVSKKSLKIPKG